MFDTLQDRLSEVFKNLRGKSRLSEADIDATAREIRLALLEKDSGYADALVGVCHTLPGPSPADKAAAAGEISSTRCTVVTLR